MEGQGQHAHSVRHLGPFDLADSTSAHLIEEPREFLLLFCHCKERERLKKT